VQLNALRRCLWSVQSRLFGCLLRRFKCLLNCPNRLACRRLPLFRLLLLSFTVCTSNLFGHPSSKRPHRVSLFSKRPYRVGLSRVAIRRKRSAGSISEPGCGLYPTKLAACALSTFAAALRAVHHRLRGPRVKVQRPAPKACGLAVSPTAARRGERPAGRRRRCRPVALSTGPGRW